MKSSFKRMVGKAGPVWQAIAPGNRPGRLLSTTTMPLDAFQRIEIAAVAGLVLCYISKVMPVRLILSGDCLPWR